MMRFKPNNYNPLLCTDYYNLGHEQMKINTDWEVSHFYNRNKPMILFGFNWTVLNILDTVINQDMIDEAENKIVHSSMKNRFNSGLWYRVLKDCNGHIPLKVEAVSDGTWVPAGSVFAQISNTVEGFGELVTWFEGYMMHSYFPSSCATEAFLMKEYLIKNKIPINNIHSFSWRAQRSFEDAVWSSLAWHLSLPGSDDLVALNFISMTDGRVPTGSIPASAHKVVQQFDKEYDAYIHQINTMEKQNESIFSMVIDTYDPDRFIKKYLVPLSNYAYEKNLKIIFRPDSGDTLAQTIEIYKIMKKNKIHDRFAVIIGDGMDFNKIKKFNKILKENKVPIDKVSYGVGSGYFKRFHRDELGWAMKTAYSNGADRMKVAKNKTSIPGKVMMYRDVSEDRKILGVENDKDMNSKFGMFFTIYEYKDGYVNKFEQEYYDIYQTVKYQNSKQKNIMYTKSLYSKIGEMKEKLSKI